MNKDIQKLYKGQSFKKDTPETEIIATIDDRLKTIYDESRTLRRQWLLNSAFSRGQQFTVLHRSEDKLLYLQEPKGRKQVTVDMISPWKEHMVASLTQAMPKPDAMPSSSDADAVSAARLGNGLLEHYWHDWRFIEKYIEMCVNVLDFGNCFAYLNYAEDGSRYKSVPAYTDDGDVVQEKKIIGDITVEVLPPQNVIVPLDGLYLDDKAWVILIFKKPIEYFAETYGEEGEKVKPETKHNRDLYKLENISNYPTGGLAVGEEDYANEIVYLQKPSTINPDGMIVVIANKTLLLNEKWPYEKLVDRYPLEHFHEKQEPKEFWARSRIERQIPLQKLYNLLWSNLAENIDDMAHLKMLVPEQSGINDIYDINEIVKFVYPYKPEFMVPGEMPAYFKETFALLENKMRDVQSYHGASLGTAVSGVRSDVHAQNLQDQDLLPMSVVDELFRSSFERFFEKVLLIAAEKLTEERVIQFTGKNKQIMYRNFKGSMLGDTRKVRVRMSNLWMRSRGITRRTILETYQMGGIADTFGRPDPQKLMRLLEFDMPEAAFEEIQKQSEIAYYELEKMLSGKPVGVYPWQNHKIHLDVKQDFMNSTDFMDIVEQAADNQDPEALKIVNIITQNVTGHEQMYMQAMQFLAPATPNNQSKSQANEGTQRPKQQGNASKPE